MIQEIPTSTVKASDQDSTNEINMIERTIKKDLDMAIGIPLALKIEIQDQAEEDIRMMKTHQKTILEQQTSTVQDTSPGRINETDLIDATKGGFKVAIDTEAQVDSDRPEEINKMKNRQKNVKEHFHIMMFVCANLKLSIILI